MTDPSESARPTPHVQYVPSKPAAMPDDAAAAACDPANIVGKYVRVVRIGAGGMGEVWRAWDRDLRRWTALKFLKTTEGEERERFLREAQTAARLSHPNICPIYEFGEHKGQWFLAMEFVDGSSLEKSKMPVSEVVDLMIPICLALDYAHQQGVIHRDLKPQNVMLTSNKWAYVTPRIWLRISFSLSDRPSMPETCARDSGKNLRLKSKFAGPSTSSRVHATRSETSVHFS